MDSPELQALLAALNGKINVSVQRDSSAAFLNQAHEHYLIGLINHALENTGIDIPGLRDRATRQDLWIRVQHDTAKRTAMALKDENIRVVFVKGVALGLTVYKRLGHRPFCDLDLLVLKKDVPLVHSVLTKLGFLKRKLRPGRQIEVEYDLESNGIRIDLHWGFTLNDWLQAPLRIPIADILGRAVERDPFLLPTHEDSLLLAATHLARTDSLKIFHIIDFERITKESLDWQTILLRAKAWKVKTPLWLGLTLAVRLLNANVDMETLSELKPPNWQCNWIMNIVNRLLLIEKKQTLKDLVLLKALCLDGWIDRMHAGAVCPIGMWRNVQQLWKK